MADRRLELVAPEPTEHELQIECSEMLRIVLLPNVAWSAIDHGHTFDRTIGRHGVAIGILEAKKRQRRGIKPGVCDYLFWQFGLGYAIELKVGDNDLSKDQEAFIGQLIGAEVECKVCWTKDQVFNTLVEWGLTRTSQAAS